MNINIEYVIPRTLDWHPTFRRIRRSARKERLVRRLCGVMQAYGRRLSLFMPLWRWTESLEIGEGDAAEERCLAFFMELEAGGCGTYQDGTWTWAEFVWQGLGENLDIPLSIPLAPLPVDRARPASTPRGRPGRLASLGYDEAQKRAFYRAKVERGPDLDPETFLHEWRAEQNHKMSQNSVSQKEADFRDISDFRDTTEVLPEVDIATSSVAKTGNFTTAEDQSLSSSLAKSLDTNVSESLSSSLAKSDAPMSQNSEAVVSQKSTYHNRMEPNEAEIQQMLAEGWTLEEIRLAVLRKQSNPKFEGAGKWPKYLRAVLTEVRNAAGQQAMPLPTVVAGGRKETEGGAAPPPRLSNAECDFVLAQSPPEEIAAIEEQARSLMRERNRELFAKLLRFENVGEVPPPLALDTLAGYRRDVIRGRRAHPPQAKTG